MTLERNNLTKAQMTVAAIEERLPDLVEARDAIENFLEMLRRKSKDDLEARIDRAGKSLVASFANGVIRDRAAVQNAITSIWSNGQTEGQITKLKIIKRQMYVRGKRDCLRHVLSERRMSSRLRQSPVTTPIDNHGRECSVSFA
ncbi:MAG: transposase [Proteobacteria bacterium]|nr:transposase [Pseudomonadota bacterium]